VVNFSYIASGPEAIYSAFQFLHDNPWPSFSSFPVTSRSKVPYELGKAHWRGFWENAWRPSASSRPEDNPFLKTFYEGEPGAAFQAQLTFLIRRFEQLRALDLGPRSNKTVVSDYILKKTNSSPASTSTIRNSIPTIATSIIFANRFRHPTWSIYLQATPEVLKEAAQEKNAAGEKAISEDYLMEVVKAYEHFFFSLHAVRPADRDTSEIDFVDRNEDLQELLKKVSAPIKGTQYFLPLGSEEEAASA